MKSRKEPIVEAEQHLYMILYPHPSLVASQVDYEKFARHLMVGSTRHYSGKLLFAEIDINFRHPFFDIDHGLEALVPHPDGRPKATKFISSYRVLEHMDFAAIQCLYLATPEGRCLRICESRLEPSKTDRELKIYAEICPLRMVVISDFNFFQFGRYVTDPKNPKGAPKIFYTQLAIDIDEFTKEYESNIMVYPPIPQLIPSKLYDAVYIMKSRNDKHTKGLLLDCPLGQISYKKIKNGFMFASPENTKFFPMPGMAKIQANYQRFWRSM
jgi:hypothetical protein